MISYSCSGQFKTDTKGWMMNADVGCLCIQQAGTASSYSIAGEASWSYGVLFAVVLDSPGCSAWPAYAECSACSAPAEYSA